MARSIKSFQKEIRELKAERDLLKKDRDIYRQWVQDKFKWFLDLLAEKSSPSVPFLLKDITVLLNKCERFYFYW